MKVIHEKLRKALEIRKALEGPSLEETRTEGARANALFQRGGEVDGGRGGMIAALRAAMRYLDVHLQSPSGGIERWSVGNDLSEPLEALLRALEDLNVGIGSPALRAPFSGGHAHSYEKTDFKARCLVASEVLQQERGHTQRKADKAILSRVKGTAQDLGIRLGNPRSKNPKSEGALEAWRRGVRRAKEEASRRNAEFALGAPEDIATRVERFRMVAATLLKRVEFECKAVERIEERKTLKADDVYSEFVRITEGPLTFEMVLDILLDPNLQRRICLLISDPLFGSGRAVLSRYVRSCTSPR
jgi:hypothetical protein